MKTTESVIDFPKEGLCSSVWEYVVDKNGTNEIWQLIPSVKQQILTIVEKILSASDLGNMNNIADLHVTGSITSNSYTQNADIDVHFSLKVWPKIHVEQIQQKVRDAAKAISLENIKIDGHPFEVYYQPNKFQDYMSVGCYDVIHDKWIVGPEMTDMSFNPYSEYFQDIQRKTEGLVQQIRNMILSIYEIAVVYKKNSLTDFAQPMRAIFISKLSEVQELYDKIRNMRKVYSSPESEEQAMKYRNSRKWKIADGAFKLFDKYGYMAILKQFASDYELMSGPEIVDAEVIDDVLSTVKNYINNPEKLVDSDKVNESIKTIAAKMRRITESWQPEFDDKPVNQWGEKWQKLKSTDWLYALVDDAAKDCQIDLYDDGPKLERLNIACIHILKNRNLIVTMFGGANGGGMRGGCNLKYYLCLVRKLLEKLVGCCKPFSDAWLIDWDNDCCDDVWTLRFVLMPSDETLAAIADCGYSVDQIVADQIQIKESKSQQSNIVYVREFKHQLGYRPEYMPKKNFDEASDSIAREYTLQMPTDTAAREIEGDAVMLLVLSDDQKAVKVGKALGDCMMKKTKHDEKTLLKHMREAFLALNKLYSKDLAKKNYAEQQVSESSKDMLTIAMLIGMLAIKNICPAATLETALKEVPKAEMRASSDAFKTAIAKATKGKSYNGMNCTNIVNAVARTIYAEAKGEGQKGQAAVASVIWNRAGGKCENLIPVISKKKQFSCWNDYTGGWTDKNYTLKIPLEAVKLGKNKEIWDNCVQLAAQLASEEFTSTIGNRNSYMNKDTADKTNVDSWGKKLDLKIGKHDFGYLANNDGFKTKKPSVYVVKKGDTLGAIAKANNTTVAELQKKNNIKNPNKIKIGQKISL